MRALLAACAFAVLARPAPAVACSHPVACFPEAVYPATGSVPPTNAQIVVEFGAYCDAAAPIAELRRVSDGAVIPTASEITTATYLGFNDDYLDESAVRLAPITELDPLTAYEVWAVGQNPGDPPDHSILAFTTSDGPSTDGPPGPLDVTLTAATPTPAACGEAAICCEPMTLQVISFTAADPDLLYTLTTDSGDVVAADIPPTANGIAVCGGNSYVEPTGFRLWMLSGHPGPVTLHVVGRDVRGQSSPELTTTTDVCPPVPPDAASGGGGGGGGGCSASGGGGGLSFSTLVLVVACITCRFRRDKSRRAATGGHEDYPRARIRMVVLPWLWRRWRR